MENLKGILIVFGIIGLILCLTMCQPTDEKGATAALLDAGYHPISVGGYGWNDCGRDDYYQTRFSAYSPDCSRVVNGCVCAGIWKGKTIRLD